MLGTLSKGNCLKTLTRLYIAIDFTLNSILLLNAYLILFLYFFIYLTYVRLCSVSRILKHLTELN